MSMITISTFVLIFLKFQKNIYISRSTGLLNTVESLGELEVLPTSCDPTGFLALPRPSLVFLSTVVLETGKMFSFPHLRPRKKCKYIMKK